MDFEFTPEQIESQGFNEEQVKFIGEQVNRHVADVKHSYDKQVKTDTENNLNNIISTMEKKTGFKHTRPEGQKIGDYMNDYASKFLDSRQSEVDKLKSEYQSKIDGFKGNEDIQNQLTAANTRIDELQKIEAEHKELVEGDYRTKYEDLLGKQNVFHERTAFGKIRPAKPDHANQYEFDAKWGDFEKGVLSEYNVVEVEPGQYKAVNKENKHIIVELSDLLSKNVSLQELLKGREQTGPNATPKKFVTVEGLPFKVPTEAKPEQVSKLIRGHITDDLKIGLTAPEYTQKFMEYQKIYRESKK